MDLDGLRCTIHGERALTSDSVDLEIELPLGAPGSAPGGASGLTVPARLVGPWRDPGVTVDLSGFPDTVGERLNVGVQDALRDTLSKTWTALQPKDD